MFYYAFLQYSQGRRQAEIQTQYGLSRGRDTDHQTTTPPRQSNKKELYLRSSVSYFCSLCDSDQPWYHPEGLQEANSREIEINGNGGFSLAGANGKRREKLAISSQIQNILYSRAVDPDPHRSAWIRIQFPSWIRIQEGKIEDKSRKNNAWKL